MLNTGINHILLFTHRTIINQIPFQRQRGDQSSNPPKGQRFQHAYGLKSIYIYLEHILPGKVRCPYVIAIDVLGNGICVGITTDPFLKGNCRIYFLAGKEVIVNKADYCISSPTQSRHFKALLRNRTVQTQNVSQFLERGLGNANNDRSRKADCNPRVMETTVHEEAIHLYCYC